MKLEMYQKLDLQCYPVAYVPRSAGVHIPMYPPDIDQEEGINRKRTAEGFFEATSKFQKML